MQHKAVNRGDKQTRRVRDRDFVKFERSRCYRDRYRCQKKSLAAAAPAIWFSETPHAENETSIAVRGSRLPPFYHKFVEIYELFPCKTAY